AVTYAPTLILVLGVLFCVVLLLSQSVTISAQANRIRDLAQTVGILEWRLRQLEQQPNPVQVPQPVALSASEAAADIAMRETPVDVPGDAPPVAATPRNAQTQPDH